MNWRKSTHSNPNGACVELGEDYRKSTHSDYQGCVEVASGVLVRDTTDRGGPVLKFDTDTWTRFTMQIKDMP